MSQVRYFDVPQEMRHLWRWAKAFDAFDLGDPGRLSRLVAETEVIPKEARTALADIVAGRRKPNKRAAAKLSVPAAERLRDAAAISAMLQDIDDRKHADIEAIADQRHVEPIEVIRGLEAEAQGLLDAAATELGVSRETIENLLRHFRKKVDQFPAL